MNCNIDSKIEYHKIDIQHGYHKIDIQHPIVKSWSRSSLCSSLCSSLVLLIPYISFYKYTSHDDDSDIIPDFVIDIKNIFFCSSFTIPYWLRYRLNRTVNNARVRASVWFPTHSYSTKDLCRLLLVPLSRFVICRVSDVIMLGDTQDTVAEFLIQWTL